MRDGQGLFQARFSFYTPSPKKTQMKKSAQPLKSRKVGKQRFPRGWNAKRVKEVITYYDRQTEEAELAEYEKATRIEKHAMMLVPKELVPEIRRLIARRHGA